MLLDEKIIDSLESLPKRISSKSIYRKADWYDDYFQKSSNEHYGNADKYAEKVLKKNLNKPVQPVIHKLKSHPSYGKNKSFKKAIDNCIENLVDRLDPFYSYYYYSENGLIQYHTRVPQYVYSNYRRERFISDISCVKILNGSGEYDQYIIRIFGIHYYINQEGYEFFYLLYPTLQSKHFKRYSHNITPLSRQDLEMYDLKNIHDMDFISDKN